MDVNIKAIYSNVLRNCRTTMELESCQNPAHTQNVFCSRITIHTHTKRVLLTHNDSHTRSVWFANTKHHSQTNAFYFRNKYSMFYTKYLQVHKTILQVRNAESCALIGRHLRTDQQGRKLVPKVTWQTNVLLFTLHNSRWRCWVSLRPPERSFFLPKIFIWCRPTVCGFYGKPRRPLTSPRMAR